MNRDRNGLRALLSRFAADRRGSISLTLVLVFITLVLFVGVAVDGTRAFFTKDVLQKSLDAAGLAAGHSLDPTYVVADGKEFFKANWANAGTTAELESDEMPNISVSEDGSTITLTAAAIMPTTFMRLGGFTTLRVEASSEIVRKTVGLELAIALDTTWSMNSPTESGGTDKKYIVMRDAALDLVDIVFGDSDSHPNLWVSVVPFAASLNIGAARTSWLSPAGQTFVSSNPTETGGDDDGNRWGETLGGATPTSTDWKGCIRARFDGEGTGTTDYDQTDEPPSTRGFDVSIMPDENSNSYNNWVVATGGSSGGCGWQCCWRYVCSPPTAPTISYSINEAKDAFDNAKGPNQHCGEPIQSLTPNKSTVVAAINNLYPNFRGATHIQLGAVWAWRTISPRWRGLWGGETPADSPVDYNSASVKKAIVLLTDGDNTHPEWGGTNITAYGENSVLFSGENDAKDYHNDATKAVCDAIKTADPDVEIYTIAFGEEVSTKADALEVMQYCASDPAYFFSAPTAEQLQTAFTVIGNQLQKLRIAK